MTAWYMYFASPATNCPSMNHFLISPVIIHVHVQVINSKLYMYSFIRFIITVAALADKEVLLDSLIYTLH